MTQIKKSLSLGSKVNEIVSVTDFGAVGDGVTNDTAAIQAAWDSKPGQLTYPRGEYIVDKLSLPDATIRHIGESDSRGAATSRLTFNPSGTATDPVIELKSMSAGNGNTFENLDIDTNDRAQYGWYMASGSSFEAIKNMQWNNCFVYNLKSGAVGWQIGDQTNTTYDTDAWNQNFYKCHARGSTGSIGWVIDATNAYNISWYDCSSGRKDGSNFMLTGIKTLRGSGLRVYNFFGDKLQSTGSPWVIDHTGGSMEVYGLSTEDRRVCKARSSGENDSSLLMMGVSVNDETGDGDTCLDTTIRTSLDNCTFGSASYNRELIATNQLATNHVFLGSSGEYTLSGVALNSSVLEGHAIGTDLDNIAVNETADLWVSTADPAAPEGWGVQKGTGTGTVARATTNAVQGNYVVDINCTASNTDTFGIINNNYSDIDVRPFRGKTINFYAVIHRDGTATPEFSVLLDGATTNVTGGATNLTTAASGGTVFCWGKVDVQSTSNTLSTLEIGIPSGQTGRCYVDSFGVIPYDFSSYLPALFVLAQNTGYDRFKSEIRAGTLRLKDYTLWVDGTGDLRILSGNRTTDTDGTVVGTQT